MAKISAGLDFGQSVVQPGRLNEVAVPRIGGGDFSALDRLGRRIESEALQKEQERAIAAEAAERATATAAMKGLQVDIDDTERDIEQGIAEGRIDKTKATEEWTRRTSELIKNGIEGVPQSHRGAVDQALQLRVRQLNSNVADAVTRRDRSDTLAGMTQTLEYLQRDYRANPDRARQSAIETVDALGPHTGMDPAQLAKVKQNWLEGAAYTRRFTEINAARTDNKALASVEASISADQDLDPQKQASLLTTAAGYRASNDQRAIAAAQRAEIAAARRERQAASAFDAAQKIVDAGKVLDPNYAATVAQMVQGTPYAAALPSLLSAAPDRTAFAMRPLSEQRAALDALQADGNTKGWNPQTQERAAKLERIHAEAVKDYGSDPLRAAADRGVLEAIAPLQLDNMDSFGATLGARVAQAQAVETVVGRPVSPLLQEEAGKVSKMIGMLPPAQKAAALAQLSQIAGPKVGGALAAQIAKDDKALGLALGLSTVQTTNGRYTSELVLRGAQALKDKTVKTENGPEVGWRAAIAREIGDAYPNEDLRRDMVEAAFLATAGLASEGRVDPRQAVRLVTGGIADRAGGKVPMPYGWTEDRFDSALRGLNAGAVSAPQVYVGGREVPMAEFLRSVPDAKLIHAGQGRYAVQAGGRIVTEANGKPATIRLQ